jgi:hypothetical protein
MNHRAELQDLLPQALPGRTNILMYSSGKHRISVGGLPDWVGRSAR